MADDSTDPSELEQRAIDVAALGAGITREQALAAIDAASTLLRRAHTLRLIAGMQGEMGRRGASDPTRPGYEHLVAKLLETVRRT